MLSNTKLVAFLKRLAAIDNDDIPSGVSGTDLRMFQRRTGIEVPWDLAAWLQVTNGPLLGTQVGLGINTGNNFTDIEYTYTLYPEWLAIGWIPIVNDGCGNYYIVPTRNEFGEGFPVFFVDLGASESTVPAYIAASTVRHFFESFLETELLQSQVPDDAPFSTLWWPFDKELVLARDPSILEFHDLPLPWEA